MISIVLLLFFSPPLASFLLWHESPGTFGDLIPVRRGVSVIRQVVDPSVEIDDTIHNSVRWRLFFPVLGHYLGLPPLLVLALSPLGCIVVLALVVGCARRSGYQWGEAACLAAVMGATSWFFTATEWLGYFDCWLVLGLLTVAFAPRRTLVWVACLLVPWIDERIVLGFPLAILVRWLRSDTETDPASWLAAEAIAPAALLIGYLGVRFYLVGRSGSPEIGSYLSHVAFANLSVTRLLFGILQGLRIGWVLVIAAVALLGRSGNREGALLLALVVALTTVIGLAIANDLSRSVMLLIPVVPFGWQLARSTKSWTRYHASPVLALVALLLPASHVVSNFTMPINNAVYELRVLKQVETLR